MSTTQYIAEALGLHHKNNNIYEEGDSKADMTVLDRITVLKFLSITKDYHDIMLKGLVVLQDGRQLTLEIILIYDGDNRYRITGALG
jgi:hypothetical protein